MNAGLAPLKNAKTILLTTYKRDGTAVDTPVSIASAAHHLDPMPLTSGASQLPQVPETSVTSGVTDMRAESPGIMRQPSGSS